MTTARQCLMLRFAALVATSMVIATVAICVPAISTATPAAGQEASRPSWVSFGDSYAAGEGLEHPTRVEGDDTFAMCQRALNDDGNSSTAWGAQVAWDVADHDRYAFVACTGAITDDLFPAPEGRWAAGQLEQARHHAGVERFDVVTLSIGGNNIDFAGILYGCIGVSVTGAVTFAGMPGGWLAAPWVGCTVSEEEMKTRIDRLTDTSTVDDSPACDQLGDNTSTSGHWDDDDNPMAEGRITAPELYDVISRCVVNPGGTVVVMGYPQLVEEADRWQLIDGTRCHRIRRADAGKLRGAAAHLNHRLRLAVEHADAHSSAKFVFIDPNDFWEGESFDLDAPSDADRSDRGKRHSLCGGGEDWLNGLTVGSEGDGLVRFQRSFHPNQAGHDAMARAAASVDYERRKVVLPDSELTKLTSCSAPCGVTGRIPYEHPVFGPITIVTFGPVKSATDPHPSTSDHGLVLAVDDAGSVVWDPRWHTGEYMTLYGPTKMDAGPVDAQGNVFIEWNPGRYNGVTVLVPTDDGFDDLRTAPSGDTLGRFYSGSVVDDDQDGTYEVLLEINSCFFSCAEGPLYQTTFDWNGADFVPRPERGRWCGHTRAHSDTYEFVAEALDVEVTGTSCFETVDQLSDEYGGEALVEALLLADAAAGPSSSVSISGWRCTVTNPSSDGSPFRCTRGDESVTFTRWFTEHPRTCVSFAADNCRTNPGTKSGT